jgi:diguanylate cyclase (GGDEF)-like protein
VRIALEDLLKPHFDVAVAASAPEALQKVHQAQPDIIVADFCMPDFDGLSLLKALRLGRHLDDEIPCLILSGLSVTEAKIRALEAGAFDYLTKPVDATELIARIRSVVARARALRRERLLQSTDELTGLSNRRGFRSFFENALRSARASNAELALVVADLNGLKKINDRHGHLFGDEAIRAMGRALANAKRSADCAARIGGDEFVVVMPGTNQAGALRFIERVDHELRDRPMAIEGTNALSVSASYGIALRQEDEGEEAFEQIFDRADRDLYGVKRVLKS